MFVLHTSNKSENLLAHLIAVLEAQPLETPFQTEIFLIQSQGMERWLSQQLANHFTVWGNSEFLFPNQFFNQLAQTLGGQLESDLFERETLLWRLLSLLEDTDAQELYPVRAYLRGKNKSLKRFQLAHQLAHIYDQYQLMRMDMLAAWSRGQRVTDHESEIWQQLFWHKLTEASGGNHRGMLWQQMIETLQQAKRGSLSKQLPSRVSIFGVNTMPPLFVQFLQALSRHSQVHLYLLSPCSEYWLDLESKKQTVKKNLLRVTKGEPELALMPIGNPFLKALGKQGQIFQEMLLEQGVFELELDSFEDPITPNFSNLEQLQYDIRHNQEANHHLQNDGSISLHACHSRMREVEVLKDQLLRILNDNPSLHLRDIVVMSPDIQVYAAFVSAVFDGIQHAIADHTLRSSSQILDTFAHFLRLSQSRFGWQGVLDLLEQPTVYPGFGLSEIDLELIRHWVSKTHIRWGQSAESRATLDLPALNENTWQAGLNRLFMGYAIGDEDGFVDDILPFAAIEGSSAQALGGLNDYLQLLFRAATELKQAYSLQQWAEKLYAYADQLFFAPVAEMEADRQTLNDLLSDLGDRYSKFHDHKVELDIIIAWLESTLSERHTSAGFLRGQITFCSMLPMRSIPFKVIALLGMNEGEFPKLDRPATFDLIGQDYRKGDRSQRMDDRYQFLETLLSTRHKLLITYVGQSIQTNEPIPPSVVISELLDVLESDYSLTNLLIEHRLQAFSHAYFENQNNPLFSYSVNHCKIAETLLQPFPEETAWWQQTLEPRSDTIIDLAELFAFFRHPQKHFVQRQLGVYLRKNETETEERESFKLASLDEYQLDQAWVAGELGHKARSDNKTLTAQGQWLSGTPGQLLFARKTADIKPFVKFIENKAVGQRLVDQPIDITVDHYRLIGKLSNLYSNSSLIYRYTSIKGKDFINAWLQHLLIQRAGLDQSTWLITADKALFFEMDSQNSAMLDKQLRLLILLYLDGQRQPSDLFVEPALTYIKQDALLKSNSRAKKTPIECAVDQLRTHIEQGFEPEMSVLYQGVDSVESLLGASFEELCTQLERVWSEVVDSSF